MKNQRLFWPQPDAITLESATPSEFTSGKAIGNIVIAGEYFQSPNNTIQGITYVSSQDPAKKVEADSWNIDSNTQVTAAFGSKAFEETGFFNLVMQVKYAGDPDKDQYSTSLNNAAYVS